MKRTKHGAELSMTVIIVAALCLLVLLVLAVIFINRSGTFSKGLGTCKGQCIAKDGVCPSPNSARVPVGTCNDGISQPIENGLCCIEV